jgi:hypothetical protein
MRGRIALHFTARLFTNCTSFLCIVDVLLGRVLVGTVIDYREFFLCIVDVLLGCVLVGLV